MGGPICHFRFSFLSCSLDGTVQEEAAAAGSTAMEYLANYCRLHGYTKADGQLRAVLLWHLTSDAQVGCIRAVFCFYVLWHPLQHLEKGCRDVSTGRTSSVLTSPSWPGLIRMLIKLAFCSS